LSCLQPGVSLQVLRCCCSVHFLIASLAIHLGIPRAGSKGIHTHTLYVLYDLCCSYFISLPNAGQLNLSCGSGNLGKIWSICRQHEIQYTE
jgi:hypothetical protein